MKPIEWNFQHIALQLYIAAPADAPLVCSIEYEPVGPALLDDCAQQGCPPFNLLTLSGLRWDEQLSPWRSEPVVTRDDHFEGGADVLLRNLLHDILPAALERGNLEPAYHCLSGYSMSGLFALYAACNTAQFTRIASASGSLWYPSLESYLATHPINPAVTTAYFSIGDRESRTRHPILSTTQAITSRIATHLATLGVTTTFVLNPGNHFTAPTHRESLALTWLLNQSGDKK